MELQTIDGYYNFQDQFIFRKYFISLPVLIIIGICFPIFIVLTLLLNNSQTQRTELVFKFKYGFLYYAFKKEFIFWELVIIARKILLTLLAVIFAEEIKFLKPYPSIILQVVVVFAVILQQQCRPYDQKQFNQLNQFESVSLITQLLCYTIFVFELSYYQKLPDSVSIINSWLFVFLNIAFFISFVRLYYQHKFKPLIQKVLVLLSKFLKLKQKTETIYALSLFQNKQQLETNPNEKIEEFSKQIDSLKGIIKLKDIQISKLKEQLLEKNEKQEKEENPSENQNYKQNGYNYLLTKQLSDSIIKEEEEVEQIEGENDRLENKNKINYYQEVNEDEQSKNFNFQKETIIFENSKLIVERINFLEGQYSEKYNCACQKVLILPKDPDQKIKSLKFDLSQEKIESQGFLIQITPHHSILTEEWEFEILYTICADLKNIDSLTTLRFSFIIEYEEDYSEEYYNFPLQLSLLDFCDFKQIQKQKVSTSDNVESNENILYEMQKKILYSQVDEEKQLLFGQFQLNLFTDIFPLFNYNIQFKDDLVNEIEIIYNQTKVFDFCQKNKKQLEINKNKQQIDLRDLTNKQTLSIANLQIQELLKLCLIMKK